MRNLPLAKGDRKAVSSLYGAFAVLLVATLVVGLVLSSGVATEDGSNRARSQARADAFLETVLESSIPLPREAGRNERALNSSGSISLRSALSRVCVEGAGPAGSINASYLEVSANELARPLARTLGAGYRIQAALGGALLFDAGSLAVEPGVAIARGEVFHPASRGFVGLTLVLSSA